MVTSVIATPAFPSRPIAADKAMASSAKLQQPRELRSGFPKKEQKRWGTVGFMIAIHALTIYALLPKFWSWQAAAGLLTLYWIT